MEQHTGNGNELVQALDVPVLQTVEQPADAPALAFFEEAEAKELEVEYVELVRAGFHNSLPLLDQMGEVVRRRQVLCEKKVTG